ncbi:MAG: Peptidase M16 protein [Parcubacteria group bacterium LiPW_41]|nr:MAG: Peptidase M16 protein [Parcubacteria group bacterium LiPW_41]
MWDPVSQFQKKVLPNGLSIYFAFIPNCEIQSTKFVVHSGSMRDSLGFLGTAHFLEHMVSSEIDTETLDNMFDEDGGDCNLGVTNRVQTKYSFTARTTSFKTLFQMFTNMLLARRSFSSGIEKERDVIQREFQRRFRFKEEYMLEERETKALYEESHILSYLYSTLGTPETIAAISDDVLCKFHQMYYVPSNMSIITIGGIPKEELFRNIQDSLFGETQKWNSLYYEPIPNIDIVRMPNPNKEILKVSDFASFTLNSMSFSSTAVIPSFVDMFAVLMFKRALQRRLFKEVREKRSWTYSIQCTAERLHCAYEFIIKSKDLSLDAEDKIIPLINQCIGEIKDDELGFKKIQRGFVNEHKFIDLNIVDTRDSAVARIFDHGRILNAEKIIEKINSVNFNQIQEVCDMMQEKFQYYKIILP